MKQKCIQQKTLTLCFEYLEDWLSIEELVLSIEELVLRIEKQVPEQR